MSLVVGEPTHQCPRCHFRMRRFYTTLPSGAESPWCHYCTTKALMARPRDPTLPPSVGMVRAALHDEQAPAELRRFAFVVLRDFRAAVEADGRVFRALVLPDALTEQATGGHGAATDGPRVSGPPPSAPVNRERGRRPDGEAEGEPT